ncbi:DUF1566 domain-containing protein [Thiorhodospira sibirica]|uniref:Lcl C-terminal domain-containing protein n=1 Tax=Thiorhodospira sibirica TaxID=154347 RepID=UPI001FEBF655|nr:DUF1566 domain-containing protein [Thiorhodospira sibirica]
MCATPSGDSAGTMKLLQDHEAALKRVEELEKLLAHERSFIGSRRYQDLYDGTVLDVRTGLQWMRCSLGQTWENGRCIGKANEYTWDAALQAAQALNASGGYAGYTDWRLPTLKELFSLVYCSSGRQKPLEFDATGEPVGGSGRCEGDYHKPTIDSLAFPKTPADFFWSSSPYASYTADDAWYVSFGYGNVGNRYKIAQYRVRLVRARQ